MPACPDCGLVFDSLYNIQLHRRSGACAQPLLPTLAKPASVPSQSSMYAGGGGVGAGYSSSPSDLLHGLGGGGARVGGYPSKGCELTVVPPIVAAADPYTTPTERELDQLLAHLRHRQAADMAERERLLLDQQVNLVLPARQAELQQSQQMLKSQLMQMKLQLLANQQAQEQGSNMDMVYLKNEIAAMRSALMSLSPGQPPSNERRRQQQQRRKPRRAVSARNAVNRRLPGAYSPPQCLRPDSYSGEGRRANTTRHYRNDEDYYDVDNGDQGSWSSLDEELRNDDSGGNVTPRDRRAGRSESPFGSSPSQQICGMLQDVHNELKNLRAMSMSPRQGTDAPFPTVSTLELGLHLLKLASLEGLDISVPLDELDVSIKLYYMSYVKDEYLLEPSIERSFPRRPPSLVRHGAKTLLFTVPPVEFIVHHPKEMVVCVLQMLYRGRLLCWATIFTKALGTFTEGLRDASFDLAKALQSPQDMMPNCSVSGFIEADAGDSLQRAESLLNQSTDSPAAFCFHSQPPPLASVLPQLPGLPPLPAPPQGHPLLPGMPGCEGPFLPPSADVNAMVMQPNKGPSARFVLPPPTGVSILEWQGKLAKHLKVLKRSRCLAVGNGVTAVKAAALAAADSSPSNKDKKTLPRTVLQGGLLRSQGQRAPEGNVPLQDLSSSDEELIEIQPEGEEEEEEEENGYVAPAESATPGKNVEAAVTSEPTPPSPESRVAQDAANPARRPLAHFADKVAVPAGDHQQSAPTPPAIVANAVEASKPITTFVPSMNTESPRSPPKQAYTPPPKHNNSSSIQSPNTPRSSTSMADRPMPISPLDSNDQKKPRTSSRGSITSGDAPLPAGSPNTKEILSLSMSGLSQGGKVPRDDMPLVERLRLRPAVDQQGNLAVPLGYKINPNNPPSVNLDKFDSAAKPPVSPCVLFGLAKPTDKAPSAPKAPGHGAKETTVDVFLDGMTGLPLNAVCTRLLVYVTDEIDPTSGKPMNPLHHPHAFMRKPDFIVYQNLTSSSVEPQFSGKFSAEISENTFAVVIAEFISAAQDATFVFGHCCLPLNKKFFAGNYMCRMKLGDPRRSQERRVGDIRPVDRVVDEQRRATEKYSQMQLELSVDSQALHNLMPAPPRKRAECTVLGYLIWRLDNDNIKDPFFEMPQQLPLSLAELAVFEGRKKHKDTTPMLKGLTTLKAVDDAFPDASPTPADALGNVVPFSEERGAFIKVEGIRGVGDDAAMYVVVVYMPKAPTGQQVCYTIMPDWFSDVGAPMYKDAPFIFAGIKYDLTNTVMYMLLKLTNLNASAKGEAKVEALGWSMNKLFLDSPNTIRQGRFALPWIAGALPPSVVKELFTQRIEPVYMRMMKANECKFLSPPATLIISQGDSACISSLVDESPGRAQPRHLLIPASLKANYPTVTCEGMVGCTLRRALEKCFGGGDPRAVLERINTAVQTYLTKTMPTFEKM